MFREFLWSWGPWIYNTLTGTIIRTQQVAKAVYNELRNDKEWTFLKNMQIPISSVAFSPVDSVYVKWRCPSKKFIQPGFEQSKEKHLPYLGFTVKIAGSDDLDISAWINDVMYCGSEKPSLREIFILWSCEHGEPYFYCLDSIEVEYVTDLGDILKKGLNEKLISIPSNV